jgi:hypothetical protein
MTVTFLQLVRLNITQQEHSPESRIGHTHSLVWSPFRVNNSLETIVS